MRLIQFKRTKNFLFLGGLIFVFTTCGDGYIEMSQNEQSSDEITFRYKNSCGLISAFFSGICSNNFGELTTEDDICVICKKKSFLPQKASYSEEQGLNLGRWVELTFYAISDQRAENYAKNPVFEFGGEDKLCIAKQGAPYIYNTQVQINGERVQKQLYAYPYSCHIGLKKWEYVAYAGAGAAGLAGAVLLVIGGANWVASTFLVGTQVQTPNLLATVTVTARKVLVDLTGFLRIYPDGGRGEWQGVYTLSRDLLTQLRPWQLWDIYRALNSLYFDEATSGLLKRQIEPWLFILQDHLHL